MVDYYKILGINSNATTDEIKKAYKQLAKKYHPDVNHNNSYAELKFKEVSEAYSVLNNMDERLNYDNKYFKNFNQKSNSSSSNFTKSKPDFNVSPELILAHFKNISSKVAGLSRSSVNQSALFKSINDLLTNDVIDYLILEDNLIINNIIIDEVLKCCKILAFPYVENLSIKLAKLAKTDTDTIHKIYKFVRKQKYVSYWFKYRGVMIIFLLILIPTIISIISPSDYSYVNTSSTNYSNNDSYHANGDLNSTFGNSNEGNNSSPDSNSFEFTKSKLIADGWEEDNFSNGQLPSCYNFKPKKSKIDNYIEVNVGSGTDVVIKVINYNTDVCIRYVYINSGTTYKIRNLPEGVYFLKIAYGKNWFSKVENGKCVGKFISNPLYKKGENLMDFHLKHHENGYSIPSFRLSLDVVQTPDADKFNSNSISEDDFNN